MFQNKSGGILVVQSKMCESKPAASYSVLKLSYPVRSNKKGMNLVNRCSTKWFNGGLLAPS